MGELERANVICLRSAGAGVKKEAAEDMPPWDLVGLWGHRWAEAGRHEDWKVPELGWGKVSG